MKPSKSHRSQAGRMKVIFIKLIGGPKLTIAFFLACGVFLLLSLIEKPGDVEPTSHRHTGRLKHHFPSSKGRSKTWSMEDYPLKQRVWEPSQYITDMTLPSCQTDKLLMILVHSTPGQSDQRKAVRNTWGTLKKVEGPLHHQTVFVIGLPSDSAERSVLLEESKQHRDILFSSVDDPDRNLSLNVQYGFHWAWTKCKPHYLLKTHDNSFVNVKLLTNYLLANDRVCSKNLYVGRRKTLQEPLPHSKRKPAALREDMKGSQYPPYASGGGYLLSRDVLEKVVTLAPYVPMGPVEDAYVGILAYLSGVNVTDSGRFTFYSSQWQICNYLYLMVVHGVNPDLQYLCLRYSEECNEKCAGQLPSSTGWK